jgi:hypothetical protein
MARGGLMSRVDGDFFPRLRVEDATKKRQHRVMRASWK